MCWESNENTKEKERIDQFHIELCIYDILLDKCDLWKVTTHIQNSHVVNRFTEIEDLVYNIIVYVILNGYKLTKTDYKVIICSLEYFKYIEMCDTVDYIGFVESNNPDIVTKYFKNLFSEIESKMNIN